MRLAFVVSHPIQYYAPLYRRLAARPGWQVKVFFTWHAGQAPVRDFGFQQDVAWDIPLTSGYEHERVPNTSRDPGTHHFLGLRNPALVDRLLAWKPDAVHVTGWAWWSHCMALRALHRKGVPTLFRGDSHLLDTRRTGARWRIKRRVLRTVYRWPAAFLYVGHANRAYYEEFGVDAGRLFKCPHSIDVARFSAPDAEDEARRWRRELDIPDERAVVLFAGKLERKKRPLELMRAMAALPAPAPILVIAGAGELAGEVAEQARRDGERYRVLPFQNQSRMPVLYRLGDLFVLPSSHGETWGLAINEAMACGRAVLVSDRVGCAADLVEPDAGRIFRWDDAAELANALRDLTADRGRLETMGRTARARAPAFDIPATEQALVRCLESLLPR
jgi:glycosyltransferase involved in cell wall biosynthesis